MDEYMATRCDIKVDFDKIDKIMKSNEISKTTFCESIGHSSSWFRHSKTGITRADLIAIRSVYGVDVELKEEPKPEVKETAKDTSVDLSEVNGWLCEIASKFDEKTSQEAIISKLDEIITTLNKLGNIGMQVLEELHKRPSKPVATLRRD